MPGVDLDKVVGATPSVLGSVPAEESEDTHARTGGAPVSDRLGRVLAALSGSMDVAEPDPAGASEAEDCGVDAIRARLALVGMAYPRRDGPERPSK